MIIGGEEPFMEVLEEFEGKALYIMMEKYENEAQVYRKKLPIFLVVGGPLQKSAIF